MMNFEAISQTTAKATNSIKAVYITRIVTDQYDKNVWMLSCPEGTLYNEESYENVFDTYDAEKRWAECEVGMKMNFEDK